MRDLNIEFRYGWTRLMLQDSRSKGNVHPNWRAEFRPLARRHRHTAAVRMAGRRRLKMCLLRRMSAHLSHATSVGLHIACAGTVQRDSRKRQRHGSKHAHQENNKHRSGRHSMHEV